MTFPSSTATVYDTQGFPRRGMFIRDCGHGMAEYHIPGDFIVGNGVDLRCDAVTAACPHRLAALFEEDGWAATPPSAISAL